MINFKIISIAAALVALATVGGYLFGHWKGYDKGIDHMEAKIEKARKAHQEKINEQVGKTAELQQKISTMQSEGPVEVVRYVRSRGVDPDCLDDAGLQQLERFREYPGELAD